MRFYTQIHQYVCGIDLHTKTMYLCILNESGDNRLSCQHSSSTQALFESDLTLSR
jgi:hypothetical protein